MAEVFEQLRKAKDNTIWLVEHPDGLADMHGLVYWAGEVERLRKVLKQAIQNA